MAGFGSSAFFGALFFVFAQLGAAPALAQRSAPLSLVPNLAPKLDLPILSRLPDVARIVPPAKVEVGVPSLIGVTPPVNVTVKTGPVLDVGLNTGALTPPLNVSVGVGTTAPGPETHVPPGATQGQHLAERRLDLLPTCR